MISKDSLLRVLSISMLIAFALIRYGVDSIVSASPSAQTTLPAVTVTNTPAPTLDATRTLAPGERLYYVENGDSLWSIAIKVYGNGAKYPLIQRANSLPDNARLQVGSALIIPPANEPEKTPTTKPTITATIAPTEIAPTPLAPTQTRVADTVASNPPIIPTTNPGFDLATATPYIVIAMNILSVFCFLGFMVCALISYDFYKRAQLIQRRKYIEKRIRTGL